MQYRAILRWSFYANFDGFDLEIVHKFQKESDGEAKQHVNLLHRVVEKVNRESPPGDQVFVIAFERVDAEQVTRFEEFSALPVL